MSADAASPAGSIAESPTKTEAAVESTAAESTLTTVLTPETPDATSVGTPVKSATADPDAAPVRAAAATLKQGKGKPAPGPCDNTDVPRARTLSGLDCGGWVTFLFPYCAVRFSGTRQ